MATIRTAGSANNNTEAHAFIMLFSFYVNS